MRSCNVFVFPTERKNGGPKRIPRYESGATRARKAPVPRHAWGIPAAQPNTNAQPNDNVGV